MLNKKGQLTIFIILAIVLVGTIAGYFLLRDVILEKAIPTSMVPIQTTFLSCLEEDLSIGIDILESQGGYIYLPNFEPGSRYMPFSSQLDFLGNPIPYWYYVSGNNIEKEQVPSQREMEEQLARYVEAEIMNCRFDNYYDEGFEIILGEPEAKVSIGNEDVLIELDMGFNINKEEESALIRSHELTVQSSLGRLYDSAREIYSQEQKTLFLEDYAVDTIRSYAPVDGVELTCSPKTWVADEVFETLQDAIESNTLALKAKSGDYVLTDEKNKYFITDVSVEEDVRFINSKEWPSTFNLAPSDGNLLIASPVGNQPGLGALGFCYVPYHFIYDVKYPVLIQISTNEELFQFPVAVVIQGNNPREALDTLAIEAEVPELCNYKNTPVEVKTYDMSSNPIEADISYECFGTSCSMGKTPLTENFPQCVNGFIIAESEGFEETRQLYSSINGGSVEVFMNKLYEKEIELELDGEKYAGEAIINFVKDDFSKTIIYPTQRTVELVEGQYDITIYVYKESNLELGATTKQECIEIPESGLIGLLGSTKEKCFDLEIPAQVVSDALAGGGNQEYYISQSELTEFNKLRLSVGSLPVPRSVEQLQNNYILFEEKGVDVKFI